MKKRKVSIAVKILVPLFSLMIIASSVSLVSLHSTIEYAADLLVSLSLGDGLQTFSNYRYHYITEDNFETDPELYDFEKWAFDAYTQKTLLNTRGDFTYAALEYNEQTKQFEVLFDFGSVLDESLPSGVIPPTESAEMLEVAKIPQQNVYFYDVKSGNKYLYSWAIAVQSPDDECEHEGIRAIGVGMYVENFSNKARAILFQTSAINIILSLGVIGLVSIAIISVIKRTRKITTFIKDVKDNGISDARLDLEDVDEVGEIAQAINEMADGLQVKDRMESELSVATAIQANMLVKDFEPFNAYKEYDVIAKMMPAKEVGGDLYDLFMIDDTHLAIVIGDVSDKGVPAALFMVLAKTFLNQAARIYKDPATVLEKVNNSLNSGNDRDMFVTCFIGILDIKTGELKYASAGHNPPFIRLNGETFEILDTKKALVLGLFRDVKYETKTIMLPNNSRLFLFTDGVTDEENEAGEIFEDENRLINFINEHSKDSLEDFVDNLKAELYRFKGTKDQFDDITMLVLDYFGPDE